MTKKKKTFNRRKSSGSKKPLLALLVTALLIVLSFFLLEKSKSLTEKSVAKPNAGERIKMPARPEAPAPVTPQGAYSSVREKPPVRIKPKAGRNGPGTVAVIIDDMGSSVQEAKALLAMNIPLTFSIIPGLAKARAVAELAHGRGGEVMLHMPMEPKGYPRQRLEKNGLLLAESEDDIKRKVNGYLDAVPFAVGANNHMGSKFTENEGKMRSVLRVLKERDLFFIDSRTSPVSVGYSLARKMELKAATRHVFLDNVQNVNAIKLQMAQVAEVARKKGGAIAICHPHPATIQALSAVMPQLQKEGITFVHASRLVM